MFERFNDRARRAIELAQEEARLLDHSFVGTEHLLLGLLLVREGIAARALDSLGISLQAVREKVKGIVGVADSAPSGSPPFTPRAKKVLELSLREALQLGDSYIGTDHMLLGIVREGEGVAAQVLVSLGADLGRVRQQVIGLMSVDRNEPELGTKATRVVVESETLGPRKRSRPSFPAQFVGVPRERRAEDSVIVVVGEGSAVITPDVAVLQIGLESRADSAGEALAQAAERSQTVLAAVKDLGVGDSALQTTGMALRPQMDEQDRSVVAYVASYSLSVRLDEVAAASRVVDAISTAAGDALRLGGFHLSASSTDAARAEAGARAVEDARRQAERLAEAAGVRLGRVLSMAGAGAESPKPPRPMLAAPRAASMPVEAGSTELTARVTVSFEIID